MIEQPLVNPAVCGLECHHRQRNEEGESGDDQFEPAVKPHQSARTFLSVHDASSQMAPRADSAHKHCQHDGHGERRAANDIRDHPGP